MENTTTPAATPASAVKEPIEAIIARKNTPAWLVAAMRVKMNWPIGREITEAQYDEGAIITGNIRIGYERPAKESTVQAAPARAAAH